MRTKYGIQGGAGSFNEEALNKYLKQNLAKCEIVYLYTTKNVLQQLEAGTIDYGLFAISNTLGGIVDETINVLGLYKFETIDQITINIRHFLMKRKDARMDDLTTIMAHPQVFKQCNKNLSAKYNNLLRISGHGDLIDTANAAKALAAMQICQDTAILGPKGLATLYNLEVIDANLQDHKDNRTTFLLVKELV